MNAVMPVETGGDSRRHGSDSKFATLEFGQFRYEPRLRQISDANGPCRIGSRAIELLDVLLESPGRLFSREELVSRVWPDTFVEESSLRVQMSALRRLFGEKARTASFISNVPGRGYVFVAPVRQSGVQQASNPPLAAPSMALRHVQGLPARRTSLVGRESALMRLGGLLDRERLVTIVGPGGVGKTSIALPAVETRATNHGATVCFADLSEITEPAQVPDLLGRSCGAELPSGDPWLAIEHRLSSGRFLVVLDNCDHLIDSVASGVDRLMHSCPRVHFVVTSREPLEIEGEWVFMVAPLELPEMQSGGRPAELLQYSAIRLFVERTRAFCEAFELTDSNAAAVEQLSTCLDGIPLAIELAAAHAELCGLEGLVGHREALLDILTRGRRTAAPRHRSLNAMLGWGFELLSRTEQSVLQALACLPGVFEIEDAVALLGPRGWGRRAVIQAVLNLCTKSMLVCELSTNQVHRYRLPNLVRLYAAKLTACSGGDCAHA